MKKKLSIASGAVLIFIAILVCIKLSTLNKDNENGLDKLDRLEVFTTVLKVVDNSNIYTVRMYEDRHVVYKDKEMYGEILSCKLESPYIDIEFVGAEYSVDIVSLSSGVANVYNMNIQLFREYICNELYTGSIVLRSISKSDSVEVFIAKEGIVRRLIFKDNRVVMTIIGVDIELPNIETYY